MDLHRQFQERIQADADPLQTQGVYADWLEEQGDSRAKLLRLAIEVRTNTELNKSYNRLNDHLEQHALLSELAREMLQQVVESDWLQDCRIPIVGVKDSEFAWSDYKWKDRPMRTWCPCTSRDHRMLPDRVFLVREYFTNPVRFNVREESELTHYQGDFDFAGPGIWREVVAWFETLDDNNNRRRLVFDTAQDCYIVADDNPGFEIYGRAYRWV